MVVCWVASVCWVGWLVAFGLLQKQIEKCCLGKRDCLKTLNYCCFVYCCSVLFNCCFKKYIHKYAFHSIYVLIIMQCVKKEFGQEDLIKFFFFF